METPRSRRESQAQTRRRLLDVAAEVLFESGYTATSLDRIADAAGFSKGAVYSNFSGKEELVLEVLDERFRNRLDDLAAGLDAAAEDPGARFDAFLGWWESMLLDEGWGAVIFEFVGATRDNPDLQKRLAERETMVIDYCTALVSAEIERFDLRPSLEARQLAGMLVALGQGLAFTRTLDPSVSPRILVHTARVMLFGSSS